MMFNIFMKVTPRFIKRKVFHFVSACDLLVSWGEPVTPGRLRFVWNEARLDFKSLERDPDWKWGRIS